MPIAYFLMTPGTEVGAFVQYPDGVQAVFFKFGDTAHPEQDLDSRRGYRTHNPDFGVGARLDNGLPWPLGTAIKNALVSSGWRLVNGTDEWFAVPPDAGWRLFQVMQHWDQRTIGQQQFDALIADIRQALAGR